MRTIRSLSISLLMLVAGAAGATDINVSDVQGAPNDPGSFTIDLANVSGASIVSARVNYPASEVVGLSASNGNCDTSTPGQINFLAMPPANGTVCTITFTFAPNATPGDYPLFVNQESCPGDPNCNANGGFLTVLGPDFTSDPIPGGSPIFLNGTVGGPAATAEISTSNTGTTDLTVLPGPLNPPLSVSPSTLQTLFPSGGDIRTIFTVSCDTADGGGYFQTFSFQTNDPDEANPSYSVFCTIDGPEAEISPQSGTELDINVPTAGATGSYQMLFQNLGTQALTITPSTLPAPFTTDGPITIPPGGPARGGQGIPWNVSCNSATPGQFATTLTLTTNDANEPTFTYPVMCTVGPQDIDPTPAAGTPYNLSTPPGVATTANLNLANRGAQFLYPQFNGLSGPLSIAPSVKVSIGPGADRDFTITCNSPTVGVFSQVLTIDSNDPDEPTITFPVTCTVGGPEFDPTPAAGTTITLATNIGTTTSGTITVSNPGFGALDVAASALTGTLSVAPPQQTIAPSGSATFTIGCAPTAATTDSQTLTLTTNDADEPTATYPVQCIGIDPGPRQISAAAGSGQVAVPNAQGNPLVVQLSQGSSPLFGETITWTLVTGSDVNIAQPVTQTNAQGRAQTDISFGPNPTNATIEARDSQDNVATFTIS
ncbi:MAG TPA: choice-of-anchor D domain-containing protein, partial [Xanthomonadales bacterium]|nr:choice-of-anchor D domain-containing protein [Xanthomonadales bacterium]